MWDYLGNKIHAPHAKISKPSADDDSEKFAVSNSARSYLRRISKLTITRGETLNPQRNVQQKDYNEGSVENIPHLSYAGPECASIVCGKTTNIREVYCAR